MIPIRPLNRENALRYGLYYAIRALPFPAVRGAVVALIRALVRLRHRAPAEPPSAPTRAALEALAAAGLVSIISPLSAGQIDDILSFLAAAPVARGSATPVNAASTGVASAAYDLPTILACPHLLGVMNDPAVLRIAAGFLGCQPTLSGAGLRWSFANEGESSYAVDVQRFHRDTEDLRILRLFIYLTDVDADSGPHQFVTGSQNSVGRLRLRPYSDADVDARFGREQVITISGPRGTAFMADMWGVHRGVPPARGSRLLFNCTYTMTATPIYRYDPVPVPGSDRYDRYVNRLMVR